MKVAFDIGGVLSKYPNIFTRLIKILRSSHDCEIHIISDMHSVDYIQKMLRMNGIYLSIDNVHSADYTTHGELCKSELLKSLNIDIMFDDFIGYLADEQSCPVRCLVMPNPHLDYYHESWKTDGSEGNFGRRKTKNTKDTES